MERINIDFIDTGQEPSSLAWPIKDILTVEQLIYSILEDKGVGPVHRQLFAIRVKRKYDVWLAPNIKIETLVQLRLGTLPGTLELRMRFRPSSYVVMLRYDKKAFEIIYSQIRYDFLHTDFSSTEKRDYILLNECILALIAHDLIVYGLENNIDHEKIFECVKLQQFIPIKAARWQRPLLYHLRNKLNLPKSIQVGLKASNRNVSRVKLSFVEMFLLEVCPDYGSETYRVVCIDNPDDPIGMDIRLRYRQTETDTSCIVDSCFATQDNKQEWFELFDIDAFCYGTLRQDTLEIDRMSGQLLRIKFRSTLEARSFMSLVDGYYRLMRKWNFNICRDITSPDLEYLKENRIHGPIGPLSTRLKLNKSGKPGSFLIRRCMITYNRYLIDVLLHNHDILSIEIGWDCNKRSYRMLKYSTELTPVTGVKVYLNHSSYKNLKHLVQEMQIRPKNSDEFMYPPQQLKHWISPSEHDDYPALLLSISQAKIVEFYEGTCKFTNSFVELPRILPTNMIQSCGEIISGTFNKLSVRSATLKGEKETIIVKGSLDKSQYVESGHAHHDLVLYQDKGTRRSENFPINLEPPQVRLADWIFVESQFIAKTIGLDLSKAALIQEYLPFGTLDKYLSDNRVIPNKTFRSILYQLASTLVFLQENCILHGKLRCHNFLVKSFKPLQIKLTDPLGTFDAYRDRAFVPPELFDDQLSGRVDSEGYLHVEEYQDGIDVWAFGTILWQVYNLGRKPAPGEFANLLPKPIACPDKVWQIIDSCWAMDAGDRISAHKIFRDLNDEFAWQSNKDAYEYVSGSRDTNSQSPDPSIASSDTISSPIMSITGSQVDLMPSQDPSLESASMQIPAAAPPPQFDRKFTKRHSYIRWKNFFRGRDYQTRNRHDELDYVEFSNESSISSTQTACSTPLGSEDTRITEVTDGTYIDGSIDFSDTRVDPSRIKLTTEIGRGNNGAVFKGFLSEECGEFSDQVIAIKRLHKQEKYIGPNELEQEYEILKDLNHENIVRTLGLVDDGDSMMLLMEFMPLGSLQTRLKNISRDDIHNLPLHKYALDIARGMEYLESKKIVHRDLALRNILVKNNNEVKICDFGLARFLDKNEYKVQTDRPLPVKWYAPEVLRTWEFTHKTDVWSYGVVLWEIYSGGDIPQYSGTYNELEKTLQYERLLIPKGCPLRMYALMMRCWALDPNNRDNFTKICQQLELLERDNDESVFPSRIIDV